MLGLGVERTAGSGLVICEFANGAIQAVSAQLSAFGVGIGAPLIAFSLLSSRISSVVIG